MCEICSVTGQQQQKDDSMSKIPSQPQVEIGYCVCKKGEQDCIEHLDKIDNGIKVLYRVWSDCGDVRVIDSFTPKAGFVFYDTPKPSSFPVIEDI